MTPLEFADTLKGKVKYRYLRALFSFPEKRAFNLNNPFLTAFNTHKSREGNTYWYEINRCHLAGEPLITMRMHPELKYKDAPKESTLFVSIVVKNNQFELIPLAFVNMSEIDVQLPPFNEPIMSSPIRKDLRGYKSNQYLVEYV